MSQNSLATEATRWENYRAALSRRLSDVEPRPSARFLMFRDYITERSQPDGPWTSADDAAFAEFATVNSGRFDYEPARMKRSFVRATLRKIAAGEDFSRKFEQTYSAPFSSYEHWADVSIPDSRAISAELRKQVRTAFDAKLQTRGECAWTVSWSGHRLDTMLFFGGPFCQFGYHRAIEFPDGSRSAGAVFWHEHLGAFTPEWDQITSDTLARDISQLILFTRDVITAIDRFTTTPNQAMPPTAPRSDA